MVFSVCGAYIWKCVHKVRALFVYNTLDERHAFYICEKFYLRVDIRLGNVRCHLWGNNITDVRPKPQAEFQVMFLSRWKAFSVHATKNATTTQRANESLSVCPDFDVVWRQRDHLLYTLYTTYHEVEYANVVTYSLGCHLDNVLKKYTDDFCLQRKKPH